MFKALGIVAIDMHDRDIRVAKWLKSRIAANGGMTKIRLVEIADEFQCTRITARNIVYRLISAGHIKAEKASNRDGYCYSLTKEVQ